MRNRNYFSFLLFTVVALFMTITSCQDYDDDISKLRIEITELRQKIDDIKQAVQSGASIKDVTPTANGITITLTNNETYSITNGQPGESGSDGTPGSVVTIGANGNWFINGSDTGNPSRGIDGVSGSYYYPHEDGYWYKVEGETEVKTDHKWLTSGSGSLTAVYENGSVTLYNVEGSDAPIVLGHAILSYLTLIPDFVSDESGAVPVVNFSTLSSDCGEIAPVTNARYRVSPKNASVESIDIENIYFMYNNPSVATRSAAINPEATFVSLENGILTVEVGINATELEEDGSGKIDQIMLIVPLKNGDEVNSDWAKVISSPTSDENLALVNTQKETEAAWSSMKLSETLAEAKSLAKTDKRVVEVQFSKSVDLSEVVRTMFTQGDWSNFNIDTYNLDISYDLQDESGNTIVNKSDSDVDQQQYISLSGSVVTSRVNEIDGPNPTLVDRNPIVHVLLKPKEGGLECNIIEGFIKLNMVEDQLSPVPSVSFAADSEIIADCGTFTLQINPSQMESSFYTPSELSKESFHNIYTWTEKSGGVGTIKQVQDPDDSQSFNLVWTVTEDEIWNNIDKSINKTGTYTAGSHLIEVTFTAEVMQPSADLSALLIENMWLDNRSYIRHNVATAEMNINNAFKTNANKLLDLAAVDNNYSGYSYEYLFDVNQPLTNVDGIVISVSPNRKSLLASSGGDDEIVLSILSQEAGVGDILVFNTESELANTLLNKETEFLKAAVQLILKNTCGREIPVNAFKYDNSFLIHFYREVDSGTVYVVPNGTGLGTSWTDGMGDIQAAIDKATAGNDVWVQGGTYNINTPIVQKQGVDLYGSFAGNESEFNGRPLKFGANSWDFISPTILDGGNKNRLMESKSGIKAETIVDGFTFENGNGVSSYVSDQGGAVFIASEFAVYQNCIFRNNTAVSHGGAVAMTRGKVHLSLFENNSTTGANTTGGGLYTNTSADFKTVVEQCTFRGNSGYQGGGIRAQGNGKTLILSTKVYNNFTDNSGSGISIAGADVELYNSLLYNNDSGNAAAGLVIAGGKISVANITFANNIGNIFISSAVAELHFENNIVFGNTTKSGATTVLSGGTTNPNIYYYNNVTGFAAANIENSAWHHGENVYISASTANAPHFKGSTSFAGNATNEDQKSELEYADFSILETSPCFDAGKTVTAVTHDIIGTARPQGSAYDVGAYEYK